MPRTYTKKAKVVHKQEAKSYKITLKVNGVEYVAEGDDLEKVILSLKVENPKTKGVVTLETDGVLSKPTYLYIPQLKKLFYPGMTGQIQRIALMKRLTM